MDLKRSRKRGPRSAVALLRRSLPKRCRALPGMASGESGASMPVVSSNNSQHFSEINSDSSPNENPNAIFKKRKVRKQGIKMLIANIQGLSAHLA